MSTLLAWVTALVTGLALAWPATSAEAQSAPMAPLTPEAQHSGDRSDYQNLITKGIAEYNLAHWNEAKAFFLRAHAIQPNARTLRTLGLVSYELRDYVDALRYLEPSLTSDVRPLTPEMRAGVITAIEEARSFIGRVVVTLEPPDASLRVQGRPVALPDDGVVLLDPGDHEIRAELKGFEPTTRWVRIEGGEQSELRLTLRPVDDAAPVTTSAATAVAPLPRTAAASDSEASWLSSLSTGQQVGLVTAAVGVVGLGVGTVFSVLAVNENSASNRSCDERSCDSAGRQHRLDAQARADVATVSFVAAGVLIVSGGLLVLLAGDVEPAESRALLAPFLGPRVAGVSYRGEF